MQLEEHTSSASAAAALDSCSATAAAAHIKTMHGNQVEVAKVTELGAVALFSIGTGATVAVDTVQVMNQEMLCMLEARP